jgi:hypothetical protein
LSGTWSMRHQKSRVATEPEELEEFKMTKAARDAIMVAARPLLKLKASFL